MKKCKDCGKCKDKTMFYGVQGECKECTKARVAKHRLENITSIKKYDQKRAMLPHRVQARKDYQSTPAGKKAVERATKNYREQNPEKYHATNIVNNAIRDGKLFAEPCEICGVIDKVHAHHDDYSKPLNVRWLCPLHHAQWHKENNVLNKGK